MTLSWYCSMCGKEVNVDIPLDKPLPKIEDVVSAQRYWIVQFNKPHTDLYCSKKCAE